MAGIYCTPENIQQFQNTCMFSVDMRKGLS